MTHPVLDLQAADTIADQLAHRRRLLAERDVLSSANQAMATWERARASTEARLSELAAAVEQAEHDSHEIDVHRERLQKQLRTVIAPREAEALQHEIATLDERRSELDDSELEALEEQTRLEDDMSALLGQERALRHEVADAEGALEVAVAGIDAALAEARIRIDEARALVDPALLARYDQLRTHDQIAAAVLSGTRCEGCHLDLSAHELDEARSEAKDGGLTDCPQCGRLLIVP